MGETHRIAKFVWLPLIFSFIFTFVFLSIPSARAACDCNCGTYVAFDGGSCPSPSIVASYAACQATCVPANCPSPTCEEIIEGCCSPSCSSSTRRSCSGGDTYSPTPCSDTSTHPECATGGGGGTEESGTAAPEGTQCCVSGAGCQPPIAGASGPRCLVGSPDPSPCSSVTTCTTVQNLHATPPNSSTPTQSLHNPLGTDDVSELIGRVIKGVMGLAGSLALLAFIYGGISWLTAAGNPEKIKKGQEIIKWTVLGMVLMFGSYIIVKFILDAITTGTAGT